MSIREETEKQEQIDKRDVIEGERKRECEREEKERCLCVKEHVSVKDSTQ